MNRVAVLTSPQKAGTKPTFTIRDIPQPVPGPNEVLVRLSLTGICGSDYAMAVGHMGPVGSILGHEGVGSIAALGSNVTALDPTVEIGQRVGIAWTRDICGSCGFCTDLVHEGETRCEKALHSGKAYDGTFAQYTLVPLRYLTRIPEDFDEIPDEEIAPILCSGVTAYKAIKSCNLTPGQWIVISGAGGGVGSLAVAFANAMGYRVIAVDTGEDREANCKAHGAEFFIDVAKASPSAEVKKITGGKGAKAIVLVATSAVAYQQAFEMLGPFGTLMCISILPEDARVYFHPLWMIQKGWKIIGSSVGTRSDILEALEFVKRRVVVPKVRWADLTELERLMEAMSKGQLQGKYVIKL
ncbi:hypothetical protein NW762_012757 [Fusarium torreyae]|uniref:Enoyl reductase (ER) domain-containing protein n=1 Tax=Fusarium torreyae TaxID=1237075 RepID=A0A9W8RLX2_9HYPO|nr:hypothetical protein NW762_012757 [Fusarium torreyae]